jgi:sodium/hydrogen antiporter
MRVMIGIQLAIAGYQLPAKYTLARWKDMFLILIPVMTMMWLATTLCILATIPKVTLLAAMVIAACVTSTDPVLSQAVAKGPFSDKYVARPVREIISAEAGANDGTPAAPNTTPASYTAVPATSIGRAAAPERPSRTGSSGR